jgi:hypothetical protein
VSQGHSVEEEGRKGSEGIRRDPRGFNIHIPYSVAPFDASHVSLPAVPSVPPKTALAWPHPTAPPVASCRPSDATVAAPTQPPLLFTLPIQHRSGIDPPDGGGRHSR